jgi:hypothetical protein
MSQAEGSRLVLHRGRDNIDRLEEEAEAAVEETRRAPPTAQEREQMVAVAAYYRALKRSFEPGHEVEDWLEAEAEVNAALGAA